MVCGTVCVVYALILCLVFGFAASCTYPNGLPLLLLVSAMVGTFMALLVALFTYEAFEFDCRRPRIAAAMGGAAAFAVTISMPVYFYFNPSIAMGALIYLHELTAG